MALNIQGTSPFALSTQFDLRAIGIMHERELADPEVAFLGGREGRIHGLLAAYGIDRGSDEIIDAYCRALVQEVAPEYLQTGDYEPTSEQAMRVGKTMFSDFMELSARLTSPTGAVPMMGVIVISEVNS